MSSVRTVFSVLQDIQDNSAKGKPLPLLSLHLEELSYEWSRMTIMMNYRIVTILQVVQEEDDDDDDDDDDDAALGSSVHKLYTIIEKPPHQMGNSIF
eukprot:6454795-Amphidinium_carterae.1